jgi:hypothetical protein
MLRVGSFSLEVRAGCKKGALKFVILAFGGANVRRGFLIV